MALTPKMKGMLAIILFFAIMLGPVCYVFIRERFFPHTEVKPTVLPVTAPVGK